MKDNRNLKTTKLPNVLKVAQVLSILLLLLLGGFVLSGGFFTSFYSLIVYIIVGIITSVIAFIYKRWLIGALNFILPITCFLLYIQFA